MTINSQWVPLFSNVYEMFMFYDFTHTFNSTLLKWLMKYMYNKMKDKADTHNKRTNEINIKIGKSIIHKTKVELSKIEHRIGIQSNYSLMQVYRNSPVVPVRNRISPSTLSSTVLEMDIKCQNNRYTHRTSLVLARSSWFVTLYFRARCNWDPASPKIANTGFSFSSAEYFTEY